MTGGRDILAYAVSHLGKSLLWTGSDALTIFFLVRYAGLSPVTAGALFMALLFWNALCDVMAGRWLDRRAVQGRPLLPIMTLAVPVACLAFPLSLLAPHGMVWLLGCGLLFRTAFAVFDVPHNALIVRLADTPARGLRLAQIRSLGSALASILIGLLAIPILADTQPSKFLLGSILLALAATSGALMIPYLVLVARFDGRSTVPVPAVLGARRRQRGALTALFMASAIGMVAIGAISKVVPHLDLSSAEWAGAALLILMIGRVGAVAVAEPVVSCLGSRRALIAAYMFMVAVVLALPVILSISAQAALVGIGLIGVAIGLIAVVSWIQLPALIRAGQAADENDRALVFGLFTMVSKVALGASGLLLALAFGRPLAGGLAGVVDQDGLFRLCAVAAAASIVAVIVLALARRNPHPDAGF